MKNEFSPLRYQEGVLSLIDQLALPAKEKWIECKSYGDVADAIVAMQVRGAPAIGCAAAYGIAIAAHGVPEDPTRFSSALKPAFDALAKTRPTAVNLCWALEQMKKSLGNATSSTNKAELIQTLEKRATEIHAEDIAMCKQIGAYGAKLISNDATVLTHCNTGALATGGYGTALGVIRATREAGKTVRVLANETRPYLQGARLTAWELHNDGFDVTVIPDSAAAFLIQRGEVSCAIVGADRIAANGDVANKIGTYSVALACNAANIPFYVAAPRSTIDMQTSTGADIPIEERGGTEMTHVGNTQLTPTNVTVRYPAFDVTPAALISNIVTDVGVLSAPYTDALKKIAQNQ